MQKFEVKKFDIYVNFI